MTHRIKLGELLVRAGVLPESHLESALVEQRRWGGRLGRVLVSMGFVSEDLLVKALSKQLGIPRADMAAAMLPPGLLELLGPEFLRENLVCPVGYDGARRVLALAMADPTVTAPAETLRTRTGLHIEPQIAAESQISQAIEELLAGRSVASAASPVTVTSPPSSAEPRLGTGPQAMVPGPTQTTGAGTGAAHTSAPPLSGFAPWPSNGSGLAGAPVSASSGFIFAPSSDLPSGAAGVRPPPLSAKPGGFASGPGPTPGSGPGPLPAGPAGAGIGLGSPLTQELLRTLELSQVQQQRAVRAILELLIEKGVITRSEYLATLNRY